MKTEVLIIAVLAAILAGGGGGFLAVQLTADGNENSANQVSAPPPTREDEETDASNWDNTNAVDKLRAEVKSLQVRLEVAERNKTELTKMVESVSAKLDKAAKTPAGDPTLKSDSRKIDLDTPEGKAAIVKLVEDQLTKRDEERAQQRSEEMKKHMEGFAAMRNKQILDKLASELSLTEVQKTDIDTVLADMSTKFAENMERGRRARENGDEYDWQAEMENVNDEALAAVKNELSSAQAHTLDTLLGEDGSLNSLAGGFGGGSGFPPPPPPGGGFPGSGD